MRHKGVFSTCLGGIQRSRRAAAFCSLYLNVPPTSVGGIRRGRSMRLNRFLPTLLAIALAASAVLYKTDGVAAAEPGDEIRKGEVVVELQPGASIEPVNERNRTSTIFQIYGTNFYRLRIPANKKEK